MPDRRKRRSADPADPAAFAAEQLPCLRTAVEELSWLLGRGYAERAALALVGDRRGLTARQREAVGRCACADGLRGELAARRVDCAQLRGRRLVLDGFNVLVTLEAALGGAVVLLARDGCARDVRGARGTWRRTESTHAALALLAGLLDEAGAAACTWVLDHGVSNAGRLRALLLEVTQERGRWEVEVTAAADARLVEAQGVIASADREVLRRCGPWVSLAREAIEARVPAAWVVDLS